MSKHYCDGCKKEIAEPYCLYTLGFALCQTCYPLFIKKYTAQNGAVVLPPSGTKLELQVVVTNP